jgi:putative ABC transport system permease protein
MRVLAYADTTTAAHLGLAGVTNLLTIEPAPGYSATHVRRDLLSLAQVGAVQTASTTVQAMDSTVDKFLGVLQIAVGVTLLLALLIAFNSASIGVDERKREHATMLAFGLPLRAVATLTLVETLVIGAIGTAIGVFAGFGVTTWVVEVNLATTLPDIDIPRHVEDPVHRT